MGKDKDKPPSNDDRKPAAPSEKSDTSDSVAEALKLADDWLGKYGGKK
jgi:hypothetical protein